MEKCGERGETGKSGEGKKKGGEGAGWRGVRYKGEEKGQRKNKK